MCAPFTVSRPSSSLHHVLLKDFSEGAVNPVPAGGCVLFVFCDSWAKNGNKRSSRSVRGTIRMSPRMLGKSVSTTIAAAAAALFYDSHPDARWHRSGGDLNLLMWWLRAPRIGRRGEHTPHRSAVTRGEEGSAWHRTRAVVLWTSRGAMGPDLVCGSVTVIYGRTCGGFWNVGNLWQDFATVFPLSLLLVVVLRLWWRCAHCAGKGALCAWPGDRGSARCPRWQQRTEVLYARMRRRGCVVTSAFDMRRVAIWRGAEAGNVRTE